MGGVAPSKGTWMSKSQARATRSPRSRAVPKVKTENASEPANAANAAAVFTAAALVAWVAEDVDDAQGDLPRPPLE